jgi:hypothetical protein
MITWATTVDPLTQSFATSSSYSVEADDANVLNSRTESKERFTISFQNWSSSSTWSSSANTRIDQTQVFLNSAESHSVLGTTDSTSFGLNGTSTTGFFYTRRSVLNVTSATTTKTYSYRATGTTESTRSYPSTTTASTTTSHNATTQSTATTRTTTTESSGTTITTTASQTAQDTCYTTVTTAAETVRTPVLATIVQADKDEVIWAVNTSSATSVSASLFAATAVGTSTTRTTVLPWIQTTTATQSSFTHTTSYTASAVTGSVAYQTESFIPATTTSVSNYFRIPNQTITATSESFSFGNAATSFTVASSQAITATIAVSTETVVTNTTGTWRGYKRGQSYSTTHQQTTTLTRRYAPTWVTSRTSTSMMQVVGYTATTTTVGAQTTLTGSYNWAYSYTTSNSNDLTTFARSVEGIETAQATELIISREGYSGVVDESGDVFLGYTCDEELGNIFGSITASVSRSVISLVPATHEYFSGSSLVGSLTVSGLSATAKESGQSETTTLDLQPFGAAIFTTQALVSSSAFDASFLGKSESVYQTLPMGVYSSSDSTFSTTVGASSWESDGGSRPALVLLTYVRAAVNAQSGGPLTWTVKRNHHPSSAALTQAAAYSAS